jgi:hypothetical protein
MWGGSTAAKSRARAAAKGPNTFCPEETIGGVAPACALGPTVADVPLAAAGFPHYARAANVRGAHRREGAHFVVDDAYIRAARTRPVEAVAMLAYGLSILRACATTSTDGPRSGIAIPAGRPSVSGPFAAARARLLAAAAGPHCLE